MHCEMFLCFSSILPRELHSVWKQFLSEFISLCFEISEIVSPVVHNSSPEGNIPLDALKGKKNYCILLSKGVHFYDESTFN